MNEENFLVAVTFGQAGQERHVTAALKHLAIPVIKTRSVKVHRTKYLLRVALASRWNQRLVSAPGPGLIETGVLAETGFVAEEQRGLAFSVFF